MAGNIWLVDYDADYLFWVLVLQLELLLMRMLKLWDNKKEYRAHKDNLDNINHKYIYNYKIN